MRSSSSSSSAPKHMPLEFPLTSMTFNGLLDVVAFSAVGNLVGRCINFYKPKPTFFGKVETINLSNVTICCALFITIDRFVQFLLSKANIKHSLVSAIRIAVDITASISLFNYASSNFKILSSLEFNSAATFLAVACFVYANMHIYLESFDNRL